MNLVLVCSVHLMYVGSCVQPYYHVGAHGVNRLIDSATLKVSPGQSKAYLNPVKGSMTETLHICV